MSPSCTWIKICFFFSFSSVLCPCYYLSLHKNSRGVEGETSPSLTTPSYDFSLSYIPLFFLNYTFLTIISACLNVLQKQNQNTSNPMFPATIFSLPLYLETYLGKRCVWHCRGKLNKYLLKERVSERMKNWKGLMNHCLQYKSNVLCIVYSSHKALLHMVIEK